MIARALIASAVVALGVAPSAMATQRFASPTGVGDCLSADTACSYETALTGAGGGDEVIIAPGDYGSAGTPGSTSTYVQSSALDVHGVAGQPRPRIFANGTYPLLLINTASSVRHLDIHRVSSTPGAALYFYGALADDLVVTDDGGSGSAACRLNYTNTLRNSVCRTTGSSTSAVLVSSTFAGPNVATLRNVTAVASGSGSAGLWVAGDNLGDATVTAVNSVLEGIVGIHSSGVSAHHGTANTSYSQHHPDQQDPNSAINGSASDLFAYPLFVDFSGGDFHQASDSPTVDKGLDDPANGTTDYDGEARTQGAHTDIGADEYAPPAPPVDPGNGNGTGNGNGNQPGNGTPGPTGPLTPFDGLRFDSKSATLAKKRIALAATCVGAPGDHCRGTVTLTSTSKAKAKPKSSAKSKPKPKPKAVGKASFDVVSGSAVQITIRLSNSALKELKKRKLTVTATAVARNNANESKQTTARITIKPEKRKKKKR